MNPLALEDEIKKIAKKLSCGDRFLAEELVSEMYLGLWTIKQGMGNGYYLNAAKNIALEYLRSKRWNYSYMNAHPHISLDSMLEVGFQIDTDGKVYEPEK